MLFLVIFLCAAYRDGRFCRSVIFKQGKLTQEKKGKTNEPNGTYVEFIPDIEIFKKYQFQKEFILKRIWHYAYLNTGLVLRI